MKKLCWQNLTDLVRTSNTKKFRYSISSDGRTNSSYWLTIKSRCPGLEGITQDSKPYFSWLLAKDRMEQIHQYLEREDK